MINPNPGLQRRKCTISIAGRDLSDHGRRFLIKRQLLRWGRGRGRSKKEKIWERSCCMSTVYHSYLASSAAARFRGRLGVLLSDWLEVPQKGAHLWHVPPPPLEKKDGTLRPHRGLCHLQTGRGISESNKKSPEKYFLNVLHSWNFPWQGSCHGNNSYLMPTESYPLIILLHVPVPARSWQNNSGSFILVLHCCPQLYSIYPIWLLCFTLLSAPPCFLSTGGWCGWEDQ